MKNRNLPSRTGRLLWSKSDTDKYEIKIELNYLAGGLLFREACGALNQENETCDE